MIVCICGFLCGFARQTADNIVDTGQQQDDLRRKHAEKHTG